LCIELTNAGFKFVRQPIFPVLYKGETIGEYRLDLIVEDLVVIEIKRVGRFDPIFEAQVLTYLKVTRKKLGLLMNFNSRLLRDGIKRFVLTRPFLIFLTNSFSVPLCLCVSVAESWT